MNTNIESFQKNKFCIVKNAISADMRDFVTQYALFDEMQDFKNGDSQVPSAHSKYADPAMEVVLLNLHKVLEENTGLKLYPTYSYYRVYRPGDTLEPHTDRGSCEISATLCFNVSDDCVNTPWPIYMAGKKLSLEPGDMAIYNGCELEHWREPFVTLNDQSWHVQGFFHYVDVNGKFADNKYDGRTSIGELPDDKRSNKMNVVPGKSYIQYT